LNGIDGASKGWSLTAPVRNLYLQDKMKTTKRKMVIDTGQGEILPCGCEVGYLHCPEAGRLWDEVNRIYARTGYSQEYIKARDAYRRHCGLNRE